MLKLAGRTAVVTGAAGGIGRGIALALARRGCHLALADIDEQALTRTAAEIADQEAARPLRVSHHHLDVSNRAAVAAFPAQVMAAHGAVDILVNNAGVALGGTFLEVAESDFDWLVGINFWGVVQMTRAFLPLLSNSEEARIVNVSSLFGLIAPPGQTAYAASKFAVRGFSESLRQELADTRIGVTVVHPGGIATSIAKNARMPASLSADEAAKRRTFFDSFLTMPPETAGEIIVRGVEQRKARILVGSDAKYAALVERLMPVNYWKWLGRGGKKMIVWILSIAVALILLKMLGLALFTAWTAHQVETNMPPRGKFIDIDGVRLHYIDKGNGPPLVLIHGLAGQVLNFTHSLLGRLSHDFRVIILDRPGSGYSLRPDETLAPLTAQARIINRFCQALGLERPVIVGHSLGGAIALALALDHPGEVGALALIAPVTHQPESVPAPFVGFFIGSPLMRRLVAWTVATPLAIANRERALAALFGPQPVPEDFATRGGGLLSLRPRAFIGASTDVTAAEADLVAMPARYKDLTMPIGILYGTDDRILDPALHAQGFVAKVPGTELEMIEGAGHMLLISSADQVAAFVARIAHRAAATDAPLAPVG